MGVAEIARQRRREIETELASIDQFLADYSKFSGAPVITKRPGRPEEIAKAVTSILREAKVPMQRGAILAALTERGVVIISPDRERYLGTILWRWRSRFVNEPGRGYRMVR